MKTDDLIACLAADATPQPPGMLERRLISVLPLAALAALAGVLLWLGLRADLARAVTGGVFWAKAAFSLLVMGGGLWLLSRAGRPGALARWPVLMLVLTLAAALVAGLTQYLLAGEPDRTALVMGVSARVCSTNIAILSLVSAPLTVWAARRFAPLRPGLAGAALGLLIGGIAATVYGLHCPERTFVFIGLWYTLGMAVPAIVGVIAGRFLWRW